MTWQLREQFPTSDSQGYNLGSLLSGFIRTAHWADENLEIKLFAGNHQPDLYNFFEQIRFQGTESSMAFVQDQYYPNKILSIHTVINTFPISARLKLLSPSASSWLNSNLCCHIHCRTMLVVKCSSLLVSGALVLPVVVKFMTCCLMQSHDVVPVVVLGHSVA